MTPEQLKMSILQKAMEGKLVPQDPNDEPASELLKRIKKEKEQLIKEKKIKRDKNESQIFRENGVYYEKFADGRIEKLEVPYEIPESWEWVRLGSVSQIIADGTHKTPHYTESGVKFLSVQNISSGEFTFDKLKFISEEEHKELIKRVKPEKNDILFCRIGTLGKAIKNTLDFDFSIFVSLGLIRLVDDSIVDYVISAMNSPLGTKWIDDNKVGGGTHTYKINLRDIPTFLIPIPPLNEQARIIKMIDFISTKVKTYEENYNQLITLNEEFPEKLRKSILQYAMQGKLVPQDPSDNSVDELLEQIRSEKQKLYKEGKIKKKDLEDHIIFQGKDNLYYENKKGKNVEVDLDFDRHPNWLLQKVSDIFISHPTKSNQIKKTEIKESGEIPVISQSSILVEGYSDDKTKTFKVDKPVIIFGDHTRNIKHIDFDFIVGADGVKILEPIFIDSKFAEYSLLAILHYLKNRGYARHYSYLKEKIIAIPSKSTQKAIVKKIEESFQLLNKIN